MSKSVADHINALFLAREAYIQGESDRVLKAALKQRVYKRGEDIQTGDWIYFNNTGKWQGPVKVTTKDGKSLYVVRGGRLLTINSDHAQLAGFEGEFVRNPNLKEGDTKDTKESEMKSKEMHDKLVIVTNKEKDKQEKGSVQEVQEDQQNHEENQVNRSGASNDDMQDKNDDAQEASNESDKALELLDTSKESSKIKVKKDDTIRYKKGESSEWIEAKVLCRAGKVGSKYDDW